MSADTLQMLREEGWTVQIATEATDDAPTVYVAERGSYSDDPLESDYVLTYTTEETAAELLARPEARPA